ncbi:MAG TPA: Gfo/Idh/MocA family oxidoreductase [Pirellulales bacterium]|nr:Gfo/Idh/MocA family oxidoreductase [Pirellulales bacterium]
MNQHERPSVTGGKSNRSRRDFLKVAGAAMAVPYFVPSSALGNSETPAASDRIVMAGIGIGNMGRGDQGAFLGRKDVQYIAMCDVREANREQSKAKIDEHYANKDCQIYNDFREVLARPDIDAVHIATPDHWHAIMVIEACRNGKDVYCQKPETLTLREGPLMIAAARRYGRVVSGGSQRVLEDYRKFVDPAWAGELGTIKSINVSVGPLPQLCNLPAEEMAEKIDWDMWLGPAAWGPYNSKRCSGSFSINGSSWRSFSDYSGGGMTDWGAHHFGGATFICDVRDQQPKEVVYHETPEGKYLAYNYESGLTIYHNRPNTQNLHIEGTPDEKLPPKPVPQYQGSGGIYGDFIHCVKTRETPFRDIERAVNTCVLAHLGNIAYQLKRSLKWDAAAQQFVDDAEANRMVDRARREPWQL